MWRNWLWAAALTATRAKPTPRELIYDEMRRTVHQFAGASTTRESMAYARDALRPCTHRHSSTACIVVLNGRVFAPTYVQGKALQHVKMVARALTRAKRPVGNLAYLHHSDADGRCVRGNRGQLLPTTVIAKKKGPRQYGVMVPNPYWQQDFGATLAAAAQATPWARRDSRPFWRGSLRRPKRGCDADSGNYARFLAMTLTVGHPRHFDVKATSRPPAYANESLLRRQACVDLDGVLGRVRVPHILANLDRALDTQIREDVYYTKFKMLVHLPGSTTGSYSRNLNKLWACGSVVLYWAHSAYEHYYPGLEDGRTHLIVNVTTAKDTAERVLSDEALAARLRQGAADVQRDLVCAECLSDYLVETLRTLRSHSRGDLSFDTRESLRETLNGVNCTALDLREFAAGRRHVPSPIPPASTAPAAHEDPACLALVNIAFPPRLKQD